MAISPKELIELKHLSKVDKYVKEMNFLSQARMEEIGREAWPFLIYTYK